MRNTQSHSKKYYKNYGVVRPEGKTEEEIEFIVKNIYETIPKRDRAFMGDATLEIKKTVESIVAYDNKGNVNPRNVFYDIIKERKRSGYYGTKQEIFTAFREQRPSLFAKYNSYMFRRGERSTSFFYQNSDVGQLKGTIWFAELELPEGGKIPYSNLYLEYDFSSQEIIKASMT